MKKKADKTVFLKTLSDTFFVQSNSQNVIAKSIDCSQKAVSMHIHKFTGKEKYSRKVGRCMRVATPLRGIVKKGRFKNVGELHKEWTGLGIYD